jgi:hypothetical protein
VRGSGERKGVGRVDRLGGVWLDRRRKRTRKATRAKEGERRRRRTCLFGGLRSSSSSSLVATRSSADESHEREGKCKEDEVGGGRMRTGQLTLYLERSGGLGRSEECRRQDCSPTDNFNERQKSQRCRDTIWRWTGSKVKGQIVMRKS